MVCFRTLFTLCIGSWWIGTAFADALVVTQAMKASTIVEVYVEPDEVRFEIELGTSDLLAFSNCLPDTLYERVTGDSEPMESRLARFFKQDLVVLADGEPLSGRLESIEVARKVSRDEITGEPLTDLQPDDQKQGDQQSDKSQQGQQGNSPAEAPIVLRLVLVFPFEDPPASLTFRPPGAAGGQVADIGFVCYHRGLPVNDFRYLGSEVTLDLDWEDPWYSRFQHRNLWRRFDAPLSVFLYVEPYEVRKEVIVRPRDLRDALDLEFREGVIPVSEQESLKERVAEFLVANSPVEIDGKQVTGRLDRIHFIHRSLRSTGVIEPAVDLDATSATLGVIIVYPVDHLPEEVSLTCELFSPKIQSIPGVASDEAGGLPATLTPEDPVLVWKNYLTNPSDASLIRVASPPSRPTVLVPMLTIGCALIAIVMGAVAIRRWRSVDGKALGPGVVMAAAVVVGIVASPWWRVEVPNPFAEERSISEKEASDVMASLLHNVYRSFDHHDDRLIYDRLAKSISGDLLEDVYLETRQSMEVKNQGGLRISVKEVDVKNLERVNRVGLGEDFRCRWQVSGWIGHWGHIHARDNEHVARITLSDDDGEWRITSMEMLDAVPTDDFSVEEMSTGERLEEDGA